MPEPISITISNLPQIQAAFAKAPRLMAQQLNRAIAKTLFNIQRKSMYRTPVDTGRLRASTSVQLYNLKGEVGTHTEYDVYVHDGTRYMRARPYLTQAVDAADPQTQKFFTDAVDAVLSEIGRST